MKLTISSQITVEIKKSTQPKKKKCSAPQETTEQSKSSKNTVIITQN